MGTAPYTADIGRGPETFATLNEIQRAVWDRISGKTSSTRWLGKIKDRTGHGARIRDARGQVVATISFNAALWTPAPDLSKPWARENKGTEIVLAAESVEIA